MSTLRMVAAGLLTAGPLAAGMLAAGLVGACAAPHDAADRYLPCRALLETQRQAWNRGDLDGFADGYLRDENLVFAGPDGVRLGFDDMLARYRARYPDRGAMGSLAFEDLAFADLGPDTVLARGTWRLERATDSPHGHFALVLRRTQRGWRIVLDYTTQDSRDAGA